MLMSKGPLDSSHQNAREETIHKPLADALNPEQRSNGPGSLICSNHATSENIKTTEQRLNIES